MLSTLPYWLAWNRVFLRYPREVSEVFRTYPREQLFVPRKKWPALPRSWIALWDELPSREIENELRWADAPGHGFLTWDDPQYPSLLREIAYPPLVLSYVGCSRALSETPFAIVGSRVPSPQGRENAMSFSRQLAELGFTIVSGLAYGIDIASHQGALSKGKTVAVLGSGLQSIYPHEHEDWVERIASHGVVISEFPLHMPPSKQSFPQRNRTISGLSLGTLVVEASIRSGSLLTARYASEQGREVFAIPGSIHNPVASGCHRLIQTGAKLVQSLEDIVEEFPRLPIVQDHRDRVRREERLVDRTRFFVAKGAPRNDREGREGEESASLRTVAQDERSSSFDIDRNCDNVLAFLDREPTSVDTLVQRSGLSVSVVLDGLVQLELKGSVRSVAGGYLRVDRC